MSEFVGADAAPSTTRAPRLRIKILNDVRAWLDGVEIDLGPRQQQVVLAALVVKHGQPVTMSELVEFIWGEDEPASAANTIHRSVSALRRAFEPSLPARQSGRYIAHQGGSYRFAGEDVELDLSEYRESVRRARSTCGRDAADAYATALGSGPYQTATPLKADGALRDLFSAVDAEYRHVCVEAAEVCLEAGMSAQILPALSATARANPLDESLHVALIRVLAANGMRAEAFDVHERIRSALADELGVDVGQELHDAYLALLTQAADDPAERATVADAAASGFERFRPLALPPRLRSFVGRTAELDALNGDFVTWAESEPCGPLVQILYGADGVGKSALAIAYARSIAHSFPDGHIYLDLRSTAHDAMDGAPRTALHRLLMLLGLPAESIPSDRAAQVALFRSTTAARRMLFVIDNADYEIDLSSLVPTNDRSAMLVTGRRRHIALELEHAAFCLTVGDIAEAAAARMLVERVREQLQATAPLAVTSPVSPEAARLFKLLSMAHFGSLSVEACATLACRSVESVRPLIDELLDSSLVVETVPGGYSLHPVAAVADRVGAPLPAHSREFHLGRLIHYYYCSNLLAQSYLSCFFLPKLPAEDAPPEVVVAPIANGAEAMAWFAREHVALARVARLAAEIACGIPPWMFVRSVQTGFYALSSFENWAQLAEFAAERAAEGGDDLGEAVMFRSLAGARFHQGRAVEAQQLLERAITRLTDRDRLGEAARTYMNLGMLHDRMGESGSALIAHCRASAMFRAAGDPRGPVRVMLEIGQVLLDSGEFEQAARIMSRAVEKNEELGEIRDAVYARVTLALSLAELGQQQEAVGQVERAVAKAAEIGDLTLQLEASAALVRISHRSGDQERTRQSFDVLDRVLPLFPNGAPVAPHADEIRPLRALTTPISPGVEYGS